jgi:hypothetical protein
MKPVVVLILTGMIFFLACNQDVTEVITLSTPSFSFNTSKCGGTNLQTTSILDSGLIYTFDDTLSIDFGVTANCCPDSGRFLVFNSPGNDTLLITVVDTAEYACRCLCPYTIHAEYVGLTKDSYVVRCQFINVMNPSDTDDSLYVVRVHRPG